MTIYFSSCLKSLFDVKWKENGLYLRNQNTKLMTTILNHQKSEDAYNGFNRVNV